MGAADGQPGPPAYGARGGLMRRRRSGHYSAYSADPGQVTDGARDMDRVR